MLRIEDNNEQSLPADHRLVARGMHSGGDHLKEPDPFATLESFFLLFLFYSYFFSCLFLISLHISQAAISWRCVAISHPHLRTQPSQA